MRTFIAVEVPEEIQKKVNDYSSTLNGLFNDGIKWVSQENLHFTIKFIGEIPESKLDYVDHHFVQFYLSVIYFLNLLHICLTSLFFLEILLLFVASLVSPVLAHAYEFL